MFASPPCSRRRHRTLQHYLAHSRHSSSIWHIAKRTSGSMPTSRTRRQAHFEMFRGAEESAACHRRPREHAAEWLSPAAPFDNHQVTGRKMRQIWASCDSIRPRDVRPKSRTTRFITFDGGQDLKMGYMRTQRLQTAVPGSMDRQRPSSSHDG